MLESNQRVINDVAASILKLGGGPGYRTLVVAMLARQRRRPRLPP
jgi:hypothetical protein